MENPRGFTKCRVLPVANASLATFPVLGGISGSTRTRLNMAGEAAISVSRETKPTTEVHKEGIGYKQGIKLKFNLCDLCDLLLTRLLNSCVPNPKNKKSASKIEALFPSGGKPLPSLVRAHLRQSRFDIYAP